MAKKSKRKPPKRKQVKAHPPVKKVPPAKEPKPPKCTHPIYRGPYQPGAGIGICAVCGKRRSW